MRWLSSRRERRDRADVAGAAAHSLPVAEEADEDQAAGEPTDLARSRREPCRPERAEPAEDERAPARLGASLGAQIRGGQRIGFVPLPSPIEESPVFAPARSERAPRTVTSPAAIEAELDGCASRAHVPRLAAHLAGAYTAAAACFVVHEDVADEEGRIRVGEGLRADGTRVRAAAQGIFPGVVSSGEPYRGAPPERGPAIDVLRALGRADVGEIVVQPILARGRVVSLLYADNGSEPMSDASTAALAAVCQRVSRTYTRLLLERRRASA